jgi:hypothetical protein
VQLTACIIKHNTKQEYGASGLSMSTLALNARFMELLAD